MGIGACRILVIRPGEPPRHETYKSAYEAKERFHQLVDGFLGSGLTYADYGLVVDEATRDAVLLSDGTRVERRV